MITCAKCGKENQDHYKYCLGCGGELSKSSGPRFSPQTPSQGVERATATVKPDAPASAVAGDSPGATVPAVPAPQISSATAPAGTPRAAHSGVECPQCGHANGPNSHFCSACGFNLGAAPAAPVEVQPPPGVGNATSIVLVALQADGTEAGSHALPNEPRVILGRDVGGIFSGDSYLSPRHATISRKNGQVTVRDENSLNGVYIKLKPQQPWALQFGDIFRIGQEIIRLEALDAPPQPADGVQRLGSPKNGYLGRLALVIGRDTSGNAFVIPSSGVHCGRERGDILFSEDGYVSGLHCRVAPNAQGQLELTDVGSSNGTFVRLRAEHTLMPGDILLMGQQLFRVDIS